MESGSLSSCTPFTTGVVPRAAASAPMDMSNRTVIRVGPGFIIDGRHARRPRPRARGQTHTQNRRHTEQRGDNPQAAYTQQTSSPSRHLHATRREPRLEASPCGPMSCSILQGVIALYLVPEEVAGRPSRDPPRPSKRVGDGICMTISCRMLAEADELGLDELLCGSRASDESSCANALTCVVRRLHSGRNPGAGVGEYLWITRAFVHSPEAREGPRDQCEDLAHVGERVDELGLRGDEAGELLIRACVSEL